MVEHTATISWERGEDSFVDNKYSRSHTWRFDGGAVVPASSSPHVVRLPFSDPAAVDPEEAPVAAVSSCHLLSFLYQAAKQKFCVDRYFDEAVGVLDKNADGHLAVTRVTLRPKVEFSSARLPTTDQIEQLHHAAHEECYIANSVKTDIRCEPVLT